MNFFKEHNEVVRPEWLGAKWEDTSCSNDTMPHATLYLETAEYRAARALSTSGLVFAPVVEIWVNYAKPEDRDSDHLYEVMFMRDWADESGDDERLYIGDDEAVAMIWARAARSAQSMIAQILVRPDLMACRSFSELHDHCDANMLGDAEQLILDGEQYRTSDDDPDVSITEWTNKVHEACMRIVNQWIASRRPVAETPLPAKQFKALLKSVRTGELKLSDIEVPPPTRKRKR